MTTRGLLKNNLRLKLFASGVLLLVLFALGFHLIGPYEVGATTIPRIFNYQAKITNSSGVTVANGALSIAFVIYDAVTGGNCLWSSANTDANTATVDCGAPGQISVTATDGVVSVLLGDTTGGTQNTIPAFADSVAGLYLGVRVSSDSEMTPRKRIVSSLLAEESADAELLDGFNSSQTGGTSAVVPVTTSNGNLLLTGSPQGTGVTQGTVSINPAAVQVATNEILFGVSVDGASRFSVDGEGDVTIAGTLGLSGNLDLANNLILNIGNASTDFTTGGGLNLASGLAIADTTTELTLSSASPTVAIGNAGALSFTDGTNTLLTLTDSGTTGSLTVTGLLTGAVINTSGLLSSEAQLAVARGGTGASTLTSNGVLYGGGTGAIQATAAGGAGTLCLVATNGAAPTFSSCAGALGGAAWSSITNPTTNLSLSHTENTTTFTWDTVDPASAFDAFSFAIINDAATDANTQRLVVIQNNDAAGSTATERLLVLNNADTTEAVTTALEIAAAAGAITTALDVSDAEIVTALSAGANDITATNWSIAGATGSITTVGDIAVNGGDLTTTATTFNLVNATATTVNLAGAGTTISIGAGTGTTTVNNALTVTGTFTANGTLTANGLVTLGDNGDTVAINSSDWDVSTTGAASGLASIASDDNQSTLNTNIPVTGIDATSHTLNFQIDGNTGISIAATGDGVGGVGARTVQIGVSAAADIVTIGDANADVSIADVQWSVTAAGVATFASLATGATTMTGNLDMSNNLILNIGAAGTDFTTSGGLTLAAGITLSDTTTEVTLSSTTPTVSLANTGTLTVTDGTNTLLTLADSGTSGTLTVTAIDCTDCINGTDLVDTIALDAAFVIGDNSNTIAIDSNDWDVSTTGAASGLASIASDDNQSTLNTNIPVTGIDATSHTLNFQIDGNTGISIAATGDGVGGVGARTVQIGVSAAADIVTIGDANADVSIADVQWSVTAAGVASFASLSTGATTMTGNLDMSNNLILNIGAAGTDFTTGGGLTLAAGITLSDTTTEVTLSSTTPTVSLANTGTLTVTDGTNTLLTLADSGTSGTLTVTAIDCTDCINFDDIADSPSLDAATDVNLGANLFSIDLDSSGDFEVRDGTTTLARFEDNSTIDFIFPAAGLFLIDGATTANTTTDGVVDINVASATDAFEGINLDFQVDDDGVSETLIGTLINIDDNATTANDTVYGLYIDAEDAGAADADLVPTASIAIDNSDTDNAIGTGILFISAGGGFTTGINTAGATTDLIGGTNEDLTLTANGTGDIVFSVDSGTPIVVSGGADADTDITTATNERLNITANGTGDIFFALDSGTQALYDFSGTATATFVSGSYGATATLAAGATLTGIALDLSTNLTMDAGGNSLTGLLVTVANGGAGATYGIDITGAADNGVRFGGATTDITTVTNEALTITAAGTGDITLSGDADTDVVFSGITTDITTGTNENLTIAPNGSGATIFTLDALTNVQMTGTVASDVDLDLLAISLTDNAGASLGALYGLSVTNIDNGANVGVPDALVYLNNANAAETVAEGLRIEQTGAGTLTTALGITRTAGTVTNGILFTGTITTDVTSASGRNLTLSAGGTGDITLSGDGDTNVVFSGITADITTGTNEALTITANGTGDITLSGDGDTNVVFSGITTDITTATDEDLVIEINGSGDLGINVDSNTNVQISTTVAGGAPGVDMLTVGNGGQGGQPSITNGVDALQLTFGSSNASGNVIDITPSFAGGTLDLLTYTVIDIDAFSATNVLGIDTVRGISIGNLTENNLVEISSTALMVGSGWDTDLAFVDSAVSITMGNGGSLSLAASGDTFLNISDQGTEALFTLTGMLCVDAAGGAACPAFAAGRLFVDTAGTVADDPGDVFDLAEFYPASEPVEAGDLLVVDVSSDVRVRKSPPNHTEAFVGVASTTPAIAIEEGWFSVGGVTQREPTKPLVALVGRVPVKVTSENGFITPGDPLTASSTPGHAMKATEPGYVVGTALESFSGEMGKVRMFINLGWFNGSTVVTPHNSASPSDTMSLQTLDVSGDIFLHGGSISGIGKLMSQSGSWSLDEQGILVVNEIQTKKLTTESFTARVTNERQFVGEATIPQGSQMFRVNNELVTRASKVFITFRSRVAGSWWISETGEGWFEVSLEEASANGNYTFDYWILNVEDRRTPPQAAPPEPPTVTASQAPPPPLPEQTAPEVLPNEPPPPPQDSSVATSSPPADPEPAPIPEPTIQEPIPEPVSESTEIPKAAEATEPAPTTASTEPAPEQAI